MTHHYTGLSTLIPIDLKTSYKIQLKTLLKPKSLQTKIRTHSKYLIGCCKIMGKNITSTTAVCCIWVQRETQSLYLPVKLHFYWTMTHTASVDLALQQQIPQSLTVLEALIP